MKAQVENISPVKVKLSVEVSADDVAQEEAAALKELARTVTLPGFRKGKAPMATIKRVYGGRVRADAVSRVIERTYLDALRAEGLVPVADADINLDQMAEDGGLSYTAVVEIRPKVEARGYTGLSLKKERVDVSEPEVEARLEALRREHGTFEPAPADREAEEGDLVVIDYEGSIDGVPFDGGKGEGRSLMLGSGMFIPGFEDGLKGAQAGEERILDLEFPADYRATELAGKAARFRVQVKDVKVRTLPELDDDFARETGKAETLAELKQSVGTLVRVEKGSRVESEFRERLIDALLAANPFEVPESLVKRQQTRALDGLRQDLAQRGIDLDRTGIDKQELHENYRRGAERSVRWAFLLNAIAQAEKVEVTDADLEARLRAIADADGRPYTLIRAFFSEGDRMDSLRSSLLEQKVLDLAVAGSTVEELSAEELAAGAGA